jgi:hypothetical protein
MLGYVLFIVNLHHPRELSGRNTGLDYVSGQVLLTINFTGGFGLFCLR